MIDLTSYPGWSVGWSKPDRSPIYEWASRHVDLPNVYAQPGLFSVSKSRYMIEPFHAIQDDLVREVTIIAAIQTGKTLVVEVSIPWVIVNSPGPIMWTMQTDADAQEQMKTRFNPLLEKCKPVKQLLPTDRGQKNTNEIYFGDFFFLANGANLSNLQSKSVRWKFNSELWLRNWQGLMTHARGRVTRFEELGLSKIVNESQAGVEYDEADKAWHGGTQEVWSVDCGGGHHELVWEHIAEDESRAGVIWDWDAKYKDGTPNTARMLETVRYKCPASGIEMDDTDRTREVWNQSGKYAQTNQSGSGVSRSFRWNALVNRPLKMLVKEWLDANKLASYGVMDGVKDFRNKRLALTYLDKPRESITLTTSGYRYFEYENGETWIDEVFRAMTIDRQQDHWWYEIKAWSQEGTSRQLACGRVDVVEELRRLQLRYHIKDRCVFQDAQYDKTAVYLDCQRFGWLPAHGLHKEEWPHYIGTGNRKKAVMRPFSEPNWAQAQGGRIARIQFSSDTMKSVMANLIQDGQWGLPDDVSEEYRDQMRSETYKEMRPGVYRWTPIKNPANNHLWDCGGMQVLAAMMFGVLKVPEREDKSGD